MNNLGYSIDNYHIGDVRITEDLQVDGDLTVGGTTTINDLTINNLTVDNINANNITVDELQIDGYKLPTTKGNPGDIIVATTDGSTSEWQPAFEGTARVVVNKFTALGTNQTNDFGNWRVIENTSVGTKNFTQSEWTINSEIRIKVVGYWNYQRADFTIIPTGKFGIRLNNAGLPQELYNVEATSTYAGVSFPQTVSTEGYFNLDVSLVKVNENQYNWRANLINSKQISNQFTAVGIITPEKLGVHPATFAGAVADPFTVSIEWQDNTSQSSGLSYLTPFINRYEIDLVSASSTILATSANLTTDHTLLSNLTLGDAGHTQFALLAGRDGGQILSGGITPLHDLKLKSHSIGLDNVIVKDLNTEFKKDIDMDNNNISNANLISNTDGSIQYNTPSYGLEITTQNSKSLNVVSALDAKITATNILDVAAGSVINLYNGLATQMTIDGSEIGANIPVNMNSNNITNAKDIIDASTNNKIDMADGSLLGGLSIKSNTVGVLIQENSSGNNVGISSVSGGLVVNSGQLNIRNTDAANDLSIVKQNGGDINLDVQTGGGVVKVNNSNLDMNNNSIVNANNLGVVSINNITPVGGLYASTSAGTLINNTTLTSLTPSSSVGSLSVPANGFSVGDCFHLVITGDCVFTNNDTIQITLKQNGNILAQTPSFLLEDANSGDNVFEIEADFNIRSIGAVGSIHTSFEFTYNKDSLDSRDFRGTRSNDTQTINTTIPSTLDVEFQFITKNASSTIQTQLFRLQKVF